MRIDQDTDGLMKGTNQIFALRMIDSGFPADGAVDHGQQRCGDLDKSQPAGVGSCGKSGQISSDAAAHCDNHGAPICRHSDQRIVKRLGLCPRFGGLAGGNCHQVQFGDMACQGCLQGTHMRMLQCGVRDQQNSLRREWVQPRPRSQDVYGSRKNAAADFDGITACSQFDRDCPTERICSGHERLISGQKREPHLFQRNCTECSLQLLHPKPPPGEILPFLLGISVRR